MNEQSWITIIIPIYNAEKYLTRCLDSIASQSFTNYEVIMINDGSTDSSSVICQSYSSQDSRFKYHETENQGAFSARLCGTRFVTSRYFTYCDADDYYRNKSVFQRLYDKVSSLDDEPSVVQFGFIKKYNHLYRSVQLVKQDKLVDKQTFYRNEYPKLLCSFWDTSNLTTNLCNKLYNNKLLNHLPKQAERVFWGDDLIMNLHLLQSIDNAYYLSDILYAYQQSTGGTSKFSMHAMDDLDTIKKYQLKFLDKREEDDCQRIERLLYFEMAGWFLSYIKEASQHLNDNELRQLIIKTLALPRFKLAQQYYRENPVNWEPANLLKKGDIQSYINAARIPVKTSFNNTIVKVLKELYKRI